MGSRRRPRQLTSWAAAPLLVNKLELAGWGDVLGGADMRGVRVVLGALARVLDKPAIGEGVASVQQVADRAGYSKRWTSRCLRWLEELELIAWARGTVIEGRQVPSWFRIDKQRLFALIGPARKLRDERLAQLRRDTAARLRGLKTLTLRKRGLRFRRSAQVEVGSTLPPYGEVIQPRLPPPAAQSPPDWCDEHGFAGGLLASGRPRCPHCRAIVSAATTRMNP